MTKQRRNADSARMPRRDERSTKRLEDRTRTELFEMARRLEIAGFADMSKPELVEAIRRR